MNQAPLLFGDLFFGLRSLGVPLGLGDWMLLLQALSSGAISPSLTSFYEVARALLIKDEALYDTYDQVFAAVFGDATMPSPLSEELLSWLEQAPPVAELDPEQLAALESLPLDRLRELFEQRRREQDERHDGGNRWIGTGGTSPFGHGGANPAGVRVGGQGGGRSAIQVATERRFRAYRDDQILDTRNISVALKKLRRLSRSEGEPELDVEASVDKTCRNAGELELVLQPPRKNQARVLLLMDVGGSMDPYVALVERLLSAANQLNHWRRFTSYSFHNCPYETLYPTEFGREGTPTTEVLRDHRRETFLIVVGDASMAPSELIDAHGAIDYWHRNETAGIQWLHRLRQRFPRTVWLNPMPKRWWGGWTTQVISRLYPMFPLTMGGLDDAIDSLIKGKAQPVPELDPRLLRGRSGGW